MDAVAGPSSRGTKRARSDEPADAGSGKKRPRAISVEAEQEVDELEDDAETENILLPSSVGSSTSHAADPTSYSSLRLAPSSSHPSPKLFAVSNPSLEDDAEFIPLPSEVASSASHTVDLPSDSSLRNNVPGPYLSPQHSPVSSPSLAKLLHPMNSDSIPAQKATSGSHIPMVVNSPTEFTVASSSKLQRSAPSPSPSPPPRADPEHLSAYSCPICFFPPTNATLTPCGHVCCGACLFTAVKTMTQRGAMMPETSVARCPVCRAQIPGWDGKGGGVIGLKIRAIFSFLPARDNALYSLLQSTPQAALWKKLLAILALDMSTYAYTRVADGSVKRYLGITGARLGGWVTVACTAAMILFGYDQGVFGGIIITPDFLETMGNPNASLQGTIVALYDIGCLVGALAAMAVVIMSVGALMQACAYTVSQMIVARLITGLGNGINTATAPVWQSETCKPSWRGKLVVFEMVMNIAGFSLSNWMTYGFSYVAGSAAWRVPIAFQLVFSVILLGTIPWLPESPRWLLMHGHEAEGVAVLVALQGGGATAEDDAIVDQKVEILDAVRLEKDSAPSWGDVLHMRAGETGMIQRLLLGAGAQLMQQLVGINVTSYYLPLVLQNSVGLSNNLSRLLAACNSVSYLLFSFAGIFLIERAGRRKLMMWGAAGQCVCYMFISGFLSQADDPVYGARYGAGATVFFFTYYLFFGICWQGVPWLYPVEINSLAMRTKGAALATAANWLSNYLIVEITPAGIAALGWRFYLIWMFFNALFVPVVWLLYPETANRHAHLEDIDHLYRENNTMVLVFRNKEAIQLERPQRFVNAENERTQVALAARADVLRGQGDLELADNLRKRT
ncbi:hypothetical protein DFH09DRAFT_1319456 [Mycena vulgaris]|nr:hypothetical protein DFH09DRAFT_1319456 [Mycena vulgaris]